MSANEAQKREFALLGGPTATAVHIGNRVGFMCSFTGGCVESCSIHCVCCSCDCFLPCHRLAPPLSILPALHSSLH